MVPLNAYQTRNPNFYMRDTRWPTPPASGGMGSSPLRSEMNAAYLGNFVRGQGTETRNILLTFWPSGRSRRRKRTASYFSARVGDVRNGSCATSSKEMRWKKNKSKRVCYLEFWGLEASKMLLNKHKHEHKHTFGRSSSTMTFEESVREPPRRCEEATIWRNCKKKKRENRNRAAKRVAGPKNRVSDKWVFLKKTRFYSYPTVRGHLLRARLDRIVVLSGPSE